MQAANYKILLISLMILSFATGCKAEETTSSVTHQTVAPLWPLSPLNKKQRESLLSLALKHQNFELKNIKGSLTQAQCSELLISLSDKSKRKILEPIFLTKRRDNDQITNIIDQCPNVQFDRLWFSDTLGPLIPHKNQFFGELSIDERDMYADYVFKFQTNFEFYDLSQYINSPVWGTFAEGGAASCRDPKHEVCNKLDGYNRYGFTIGTVFNAASCEVYTGPRLRVNQRIIVDTQKPKSYKTVPSFYAFAEINGEPYRLAMTSYIPGGVDVLKEPGTASFAIESIMPEFRGSCLFSSIE